MLLSVLLERCSIGTQRPAVTPVLMGLTFLRVVGPVQGPVPPVPLALLGLTVLDVGGPALGPV